MTAVSGCLESPYHKKLLLWRVYESSILVWNMERRLEGARDIIAVTSGSPQGSPRTPPDGCRSRAGGTCP